MVALHKPDSLRIFMISLSSILATIVFISAILPWFLFGVFVILAAYLCAAAFYRESARELKVRFFRGGCFVDLTNLFLLSVSVRLQNIAP